MSVNEARPDDLAAHFRDWPLDPEARAYLDFHEPRFRRLLAVAEACVAAAARDGGPTGRPPRVLDIGPGLLTQVLRDRRPGWIVDSLGFADPRFPCRPCDRHVEFDLNGCPFRERWPAAAPHDLVMMAEVIEHLAVPPGPVLAFAASWLAPGGRLVVQTPNACSLPKRLRMLRGFNPYEMIRDPSRPAGHVREYTRREMRDLAAGAGLTPVFELFDNYFRRRTAGSALFRLVTPAIPRTWRDGMTMVFERQGAHGR